MQYARLPQVGILAKEKDFLVSGNSKEVVKQGAVYFLTVGVKDIKNKVGQNMAFMVGDTVIIGKHENAVLTESLPKSFSSIFHVDTKSNPTPKAEPKPKDKPAPKEEKKEIHSNTFDEEVITKNFKYEFKEPVKILTRLQKMKARDPSVINQDLEEGKQLTEHQRQLLKDKTAELRESEPKGPKLLEIEAYPSIRDLPKLRNTKKMEWDEKNYCLWLPLGSQSLPFHILTIRNIAVQHEGRTSTIRINFSTPIKHGRQALEFPKDIKAPIYIQELVFRSADRSHYNDILQKFKDLLKQFNPLAHVKNTGPMLEVNRGPKPALDDLLLKPGISGRRTIGRLEYHKNGFRFRSRKEEEIDLLTSNIKTVAYMPADEEQVFILHFEMLEPVIYSGKKVKNLQFYTKLDEFNESIYESSEKRKRNRDSAKSMIDSEKVFSQRIMATEKAFESFVKAVEKESKNEVVFEEPDLDMRFMATMEYDQLYIYPTENCLMGVTTTPYFLVAYDEIEFVAFERAGIMNKTFDMAFIFKDYSRDVINLTSVSSAEKTMLKKLLDSKNIVIIEHNSNVKWQAVLRKFSENIEEFIDDGAWEYLGDHDKPAKAADDEGSVSDFVESDSSEVFSEADEDYSSDSDEYDEDGEEARGNDEEDEFEDDDDDLYSDDDDDEDEYEEDSEDSLVVRRKGEPKQKLKPGMSKKGRNK